MKKGKMYIIVDCRPNESYNGIFVFLDNSSKIMSLANLEEIILPDFTYLQEVESMSVEYNLI